LFCAGYIGGIYSSSHKLNQIQNKQIQLENNINSVNLELTEMYRDIFLLEKKLYFKQEKCDQLSDELDEIKNTEAGVNFYSKKQLMKCNDHLEDVLETLIFGKPLEDSN